MEFVFETGVSSDWIDYNGHMQDAYYGLVFSHALDALQDEVGFDAEYRRATGCTIYLLEYHCFFLAEVKEGDRLRVETRVLGADAKRFHLHLTMFAGGTVRAVAEKVELHVRQSPTPKAAAMPHHIAARLTAAVIPQDEAAALPNRARAMGLARTA